jgi:predicted metal-dependent enzyme (double-stranded beta helix superfamily)
MKNLIHSIICVLFVILIFGFLAESALAQDPIIVDSAHYKVEFENEQVRVVRITYGPGEKSVMHEHPDGVLVFLTDQNEIYFPGRKDRGDHCKGRRDQMGSGCETTSAGKYW